MLTTQNYPKKILGYLVALLPRIKQHCVVCGTAGGVVCQDCTRALPTLLHACRGCGVALPNTELHYCGPCLTQPLDFDRAYVLYRYQGLLKPLLHQFKYEKNLALGKFFAQRIATYYHTHSLEYDVIIPMPIHNKRLRKRGFNQAIELARLLSVPREIKQVVRHKYTQTLNQLSPKERAKEVKGAFTVSGLCARRILIIDDVLTTASSANELSKTIRKYYKQHKLPNPKIDLLVLARALS